MLHASWRAALRQTSRSPAALTTSRAASRSLPAQCSASLVARFPQRCPSPPAALCAYRSFSTSPRRCKEKDPKAAPEPAEETDEAKKLREQEKAADELEAKAKTPDPAPAPTGSGRGSAGGSGGEGGGRKRKNSPLVKPSIPEVYPQVMAIPLAKRPLFPGFYKAVTIRDREVGQAIADMVKRGQPYIGAFMFKDDAVDKDVIDDPSEVHDVGTFCQVTSAFPVGSEDNFAMTCVLYPHRRIKMTSLLPPKGDAPSAGEATIADVSDDAPAETKASESKGDVVASFEEASEDAKSKDEDQTLAILNGRQVSIATVENMVEEPFDMKNNKVIQALVNEIVNTFKGVALLNPMFRDHVATFSVHTTMSVGEDPVKLADFAAAVAQAESQELQAALEEMDVEKRLRKSLEVLKKELMSAELQKKVSDEVNNRVQKKHREFILMEQMKGIKRELGIESDGKDKLIEKFNEKAGKLAMPEGVRKVFEEEMSKLSGLEPSGSEFNVTRNYLDWLTQLPWGLSSAENFGIKHAREVLDEDHYGLKDVKDRILEFIAVGKLRGSVEGKILCLVGPPGVGKTSIGKSIARALNRQYYRFSVGGMYDVAEIKGHRRTYVGALPGRIIQALKKCQTENPLVLIDEIDKLGRNSSHGDPAAALLELLDPEQNSSFLDHYLDVPVDLSKVLFVCTANMSDTIPQPLLDRMEMIELSGYVADEKIAIAEKYLAPAAKEMSGLKDADVILEKEGIVELINKYCRESGVRNLKKQIEKVYRKSALKIVTEVGEDALPESEALTEEGKAAQEEAEKDKTDVKDTPEDIQKQTAPKPRVALKVPDTVHISIGKDNLKDYVGPPVFTADRLYDFTPPGVAMGLAWTSMGGSALYIESILQSVLSASSHPGLERTGSLRDVMKESTGVAYSYAKSVLARDFPKNRFFEHARIHLHCPEGAVPKDGPSAGITMASSFLSLALDTPIRDGVAMTGELTLTGKVLRIGGLREKTVAARRAGATMVIFPKDNLSDWLELPENIKEGIQGHPVAWYHEVFALVFPDLNKDAANRLWDKELKSKKGDKKRREQKRKDDDEESGEDSD
ncbi:Lon protease C-terminal proteolytic domain-containing protein [Boeremia exigua]|uniref:Lon protease C-terminal proteolytic domain-containing protein n=1 Tax=Boeremia exigua TaxID=749465 RepID=UPI001E8D9AB0|nr:Lon protease C-terminal proteolytic domain-containing protein [Boeremia exigua]KAH6611862.1 Lon protease C-terminal proteolytic domain-containing protein [Boeremia exigua]